MLEHTECLAGCGRCTWSLDVACQSEAIVHVFFHTHCIWASGSTYSEPCPLPRGAILGCFPCDAPRGTRTPSSGLRCLGFRVCRCTMGVSARVRSHSSLITHLDGTVSWGVLYVTVRPHVLRVVL